MAPFVAQPVKQSPEVSERSALLAPKLHPNHNYNTTQPSPCNNPAPQNQPSDHHQLEGQFFGEELSCKCRGRIFSIAFMCIILLGGMTVGGYLLNQYDREWVTNTPFQLVDRRSWRSSEPVPRIRNSRSETRTIQEDQLRNQEMSSGRQSSSAGGVQSSNPNPLPTQNQAERSGPDQSIVGVPLFQEDILEMVMEQGIEVNDFSAGEGTKQRSRKKRSDVATHVVIAHTEGSSCFKRHHCLEIVRQIQVKSTTEMGLLDIPYNFLIGGDGHTYEGRGWFGHDALQHSLKNHSTISVAFIGDFTYDVPPQRQLEEAKALIIESIRRRKLTPHYHLVGHRQINENTRSPGDALMRELSGWRHWRPCSKNEC